MERTNGSKITKYLSQSGFRKVPILICDFVLTKTLEMSSFCGLEPRTSVLLNNTKVIALDLSLQQSIEKFRELVVDLEHLHVESENYRLQYISVKDKCENKTCTGAEELKKVIETKDKIIQSVASILTQLQETKNLNILTDAFNILFENAVPLIPPTEDKSPKHSLYINSNSQTNKNNSPQENIETSIIEDVSFKDESISESDAISAGRVSPIIHTKNTRSLTKTSDFRDKKKCPNDWPTSDTKALKLTLTPSKSKSSKSGKLRQARLNLVKVKQTAVVDLTCSPEVKAEMTNKLVQPLIKKESMENDDTILPSPTSGAINFTLFKSTSKASPSKLKKPALSLKNKTEFFSKQDENKNSSKDATNCEMEESINILNQFATRIRNGIKKENNAAVEKEIDTPDKKENITCVKKEKETTVKIEMHTPVKHVPHDGDETNASISLLQHINQVEEEHRKIQHSPLKRPLAENINIMNTPPKNDAESSMSILRMDSKTAAVENAKRKIPELVEPIFKEQAVRKKAEKRNLQGWSCEECMNFYGELYKNDPVMLAKKINECSKHRGRHNPARPKTPPNFWNPRWHVPEDTEELNRMNNAT